MNEANIRGLAAQLGSSLPDAYGDAWVQKAWCVMVDTGCVDPDVAWIFPLDGGARFAVAVKVPGRALYLLNEGHEPSHFASEASTPSDAMLSVAATVEREAAALHREAARLTL